ncbi:MAG: hypothetical protein NDI69_11075 [Bacteriovoracaceae bacterium]|nr:hypothetical protein [Bacteriovoracaceae bacterium]
MRLIIALSILFPFNSIACSTYEAQFSSIVKEVVTNADHPYSCLIKLDINLSQSGQRWSPHIYCPLDIEFVLDEYISAKYCGFQKGDVISGYLLKTDDGLELD